MRFKFIGAVLIVTGTCIGAGMLALPVVTSPGGFIYSAIALVGLWLLMIIGSFYILELAQWFPKGTNLVSIAKATMGTRGAVLTWVVFLVLNYALLCAYIAGGSDIFFLVSGYFHLNINRPFLTTGFVIIMGYFVYRGIKSVDVLNRGLMTLKLFCFVVLMVLALDYIKIPNLLEGKAIYIFSSLTVIVASFGFATIVPSLLDYFDRDVKTVKRIILFGTALPLVCYILWNLAIMGIIPRSGPDGLIYILLSENATSNLITSLQGILKNNFIRNTATIFMTVSLLTSFLGVSLATTHFISDGIKFKKDKFQRIKVSCLAFLPPLAIVLFYPKLFIIALSYAGLLAVTILILLPAIMIWRGRYIKNIAKNYTVFGGKLFVVIIFLVGAFIFVTGVLNLLNWMPAIL